MTKVSVVGEREMAVERSINAYEQPAWGMLALVAAGIAIGMTGTWWPTMAGSTSWIVTAAFHGRRTAALWLRGAALILLFGAIGLGTQVYKLWESGGANRVVTNPTSAVLALVAGGAAIGIAATLWPAILRTPSAAFAEHHAPALWFRRAAVLLSFAAFALGSEAYKLWEYGGGEGVHPSPLTHDGFHIVLNLSAVVSCVLAMLVIAWGPLARANGWGFAGLAATMPCAALFVWAGVVGLAHTTEWGLQHVVLEAYVAAVPLFLLLATVCAAGGQVALRKRSTRSGSRE
jgi:hypothetical protein